MKKVKITDNKNYNLFLVYDSVEPKKVKDNFEEDPDYNEDINEDDLDLGEPEDKEINEDNVDLSEYDGFEKEDYHLIGSECKEFLEDYEKKTKKNTPRYYLILMALGKDKGWAYIKNPKELKGQIELDVVTPKNAKKIIKESR